MIRELLVPRVFLLLLVVGGVTMLLTLALLGLSGSDLAALRGWTARLAVAAAAGAAVVVALSVVLVLLS